ncbi:hypothetical protein DW837_09255 [Phocaeicola vulgatus]|nr:hypothetical protein DW837_09255 [Phocaeicola vulgatus]
MESPSCIACEGEQGGTFFRYGGLILFVGYISLVMRTVKSFCADCYYSLRQWTVQSVTVDCTVCRNETYGLLSQSVKGDRKKCFNGTEKKT